MMRKLFSSAVAITLCCSVPFAFGEQRGKGEEKQNRGNEKANKPGEKEKEGKGAAPHNSGGEKSANERKGGNKPPGGAWSEGKSNANKQSPAGHEQALEAQSKNKASPAAEGAAAEHLNAKNKPTQATGAEGAAAGAAAANSKKPGATGAEGAAAGAAVSNRNQPAASGAEGAAVGAAAANRNQPAASGAQGVAVGAAAANRNQSVGAFAAPASYAAVRNSFDHPNLYNQNWYAAHPGAWTAPNWTANTAWTATNMAGVAAFCGYTNRPVSYGYGQNVTYQNGNVMIDGQKVGTGEVYSQQAADLAMVGQNAQPSDADKWLPLGVFALVRNEDQHPQLTLQFAVNKQGILRGNYTDTVTDHTLEIHGAVDKGTQRAAWTVDNNPNFYMEAGLVNLTNGEATTLIHKQGRTEKWLLVQLPQPETDDVASR